jgi:diguanylate cyclase
MYTHSLLQNLYCATNNELLNNNQSVIESLIPISVEKYYELLLSSPETAKFLTNEIVENRLRNALATWLNSVLSPKKADELAAVLEQQHHIGQVHARINVDMSLVSEAMIVLKNSLHQGLLNHPKADQKILIVIHNILDFALMNINKVYFSDFSKVEHQSQVLRNHLSSMDFALEIEQMRNELNEWLTHCLIHKTCKPLVNTDFALWIKHKLSLVLSETGSYADIESLLYKISALADNIDFDSQKSLHQLSQMIKEMSWYLSEQSKKLVSTADKKDPLTKLYNRRFLDSILSQESIRAQKLKKNYSIIMLDIDHFKQVNDVQGHDMGDKVLAKLGDLIDQNIRISDFAFRFGGEEFLILLTECSAQKAQNITEQIAQLLSEYSFSANENTSFQITFSAGIAEFDGQPDYQHTVKHADKALYHSKENGRNQVTIWSA